jgi:hypothetical protein
MTDFKGYDLSGSIEKSVPAAPPQARLIRSIAAGFAPEIASFVKQAIAPLIERIAALESRADTAEQRGLEYCGNYQRAMNYRRGSAITEDGCLWIATRDVNPGEKPGEHPAWQLAAKKGRDAR